MIISYDLAFHASRICCTGNISNIILMRMYKLKRKDIKCKQLKKMLMLYLNIFMVTVRENVQHFSQEFSFILRYVPYQNLVVLPRIIRHMVKEVVLYFNYCTRYLITKTDDLRIFEIYFIGDLQYKWLVKHLGTI